MLNYSRRFPCSNDKPDRGHGHTYKITDDCASKVQRSKRYLRSRIAGVSTMLNTFVGNGAARHRARGLLQHVLRLLPTTDGPEVSCVQRRHEKGRRG
jgi:hypothetical protein